MRRVREISNALYDLVRPELARRPDHERPVAAIPGFSVRMASDDSAEMMIYGDIGGGWFSDGVTAPDVAEQLDALPAGTRNINVRINSKGGDVFQGVAIHTLLRRHPAMVTTHVDGLAASAASYIAQAGDRVLIAPGAMMMIHDGSTETWGNEADHLATAELLGKVSDSIADLYAARAGDDTADWRDRMRAETWYTAQEAVDAGLADEVTDDDRGQVEDRLRSAVGGQRFRNAPALPAPVLALLPEQEHGREQEQGSTAEQGSEQDGESERNADKAEIMMALLRSKMGEAA